MLAVMSATPQRMLRMTAVCSSNSKTGTRKVKAKMNFETKVEMVASQTSFALLPFFVSWETWMPKASDKASAIAMLKLPPMSTSLDPVEAKRPIIKPRVVMVPEVKPKPRPIL